MQKPVEMFDRDAEWRALSDFVSDPRPGATLGVISGRRRQGKTFLLDSVTREFGGFYFGATEALDAESLRRFGDEFTRFADLAVPARFDDWFEVFDALLSLGERAPVPVVIDEFPYLAQARSELPSIIQNAYGPRRPERTRSHTRLLLCGSAMSFMGGLLSGSAPLRGRAGLEMVVHPLDFRLAAEFWGITDPRLAIQVHAVVGGTLAYRDEFLRGDRPADVADFDDWVRRTALNPQTPLFREGRYLLSEEMSVRDPAIYSAVLSAIAEGDATRGGIAGKLNRKSGDLAHPLDVLEDARLIARDRDMFRKNRSTYRIADPYLAFYQAVMRPVWGQLERPNSAERVWEASRRTFKSKIVGPHFEQVCRDWTLDHADLSYFGGELPAMVGQGIVNDVEQRTSHEVDVAVVGVANDGKPALLAIGEAKWNDVMGRGHLERLERLRSVIAKGGQYDTGPTRLLCFSGAGFNEYLMQQSAVRDDLSLVGLDDLYGVDD